MRHRTRPDVSPFGELIKDLCAELAPELIGYEVRHDGSEIDLELLGVTGQQARVRLTGVDVGEAESRRRFLRRETRRVRPMLGG